MLVELAWFIILPILKEIKYLISKFESIKSDKNHITCAAIIGFILLFLVFPTSGTINTMAITSPLSYQNIYAPSPANIDKVFVQNGENILKDQKLAMLSSPILDKNIQLSQARLKGLLETKKREQTNPQIYRERRSLIDENIAEAMQELASLKKKQAQLEVYAPFDGKIYDLLPDIHAERSIGDTELLFRFVQKNEKKTFIAYIEETNLARISIGNKAVFTPAYRFLQPHYLTVSSIEQINNTDIEWPELSTTYGGPVTAISENQQNKSTKSFYKVTLTENKTSNGMPIIYRGYLKIHGKRSIPLVYYTKKLIALLIQESGLN
jgi:putative peptide zinc metalloprotease protein